MRPLILLLSLTLSLSAADMCAAIRALVSAEANRQGIPAISVAVVRNQRLACSIALGWADLDRRIPNTPKSRHRLASLSKPVSAVLTIQLAEEGRLTLDDSVRKFIPDLPERYEPVTIRRLLSHQSGIREYANLDEVLSIRHYASLEEAAKTIFVDSPLLFAPGERTAYTTFGYTLLGAALERATGRRFKQLLKDRIGGFVVDDFTVAIPHRVRPYRKSSDSKWEIAPAFDASNKYPGGGLLSSAADYAQFLISTSSNRLLRKESVAEMWTPQRLADGSIAPFATLGWATGMRGGHRYVTHGGLQPGTTTVMHWFPGLGSGSVILCNAEGPDLDQLQERILSILAGRETTRQSPIPTARPPGAY